MWCSCINLPLIFHEILLSLLVVWFNRGSRYLEWCQIMSYRAFQSLLIRETNAICLEYDLRSSVLEFPHSLVLDFLKQLYKTKFIRFFQVVSVKHFVN